jgi:CheY-like chemotaxis protein
LESVQEPDAERESQEEREPDLELEPELQAELQMSREAPAESRVAQEPQVEPAPQCELTPEPELAPEPELTPEPELAPELKRQDPDRTSGAALAAEAKMMRARAAQPIHDLRGQGERVLIAADRPSDLMLATQTLWKNGYRVMGVGSIEKALEYCTQPGESFELVLCDISHRAARWLRFAAQLHEKRPGLAILICGQPGGTREWGTRVGQAVTFLEKPFAAPQLLRAVRAGLNSATQAGESTEHDGGLARPA